MPRATDTVRLVLRPLWRERSFATQAILILAIGIGTTTAVFSLIPIGFGQSSGQ